MLETQEDAPQVAGVIDDRSGVMKAKQDYAESSKWKRLDTSDGKFIDSTSDVKKCSDNSRDQHLPAMPKKKPERSKLDHHGSDADPSPVRRRHDSDSDRSPVRRRHDSGSDHSPVRRRLDSDSDKSPARHRQDSDSDPSPVRRRHDSDSDHSPVRIKQEASTEDAKKSYRTEKNKSAADLGSGSSVARSTRQRVDSDGDLSPVRDSRSKVHIPDGESNVLRIKKEIIDDDDANEPTTSKGKLTRTLDGKKAGLQTGKSVREETTEFRRKENEDFTRMDESLSGRNATTQVRASKLKQLASKMKLEKEKEEKLAKIKEANSYWSKGVKQQEDRSVKLAEDVHEMSKPLARFADDQDLEKMLKEKDREGDPMAKYLASKKAKSGPNKAVRPVYNGPAPAPNRFMIQPGYRWDGVDRSNGFEKMYFEKQNKAVAVQEEAYKWSVSDM